MIVVSRQSSLQDLTKEQAQALFAGQGDLSAQVWVYASGADIQRVFDQLMMAGRSETSLARLATSPQEMSDALTADPNAVGILPRRLLGNGLREVYTIPSAPVLAITRSEPQGAVKDLLACLQK